MAADLNTSGDVTTVLTLTSDVVQRFEGVDLSLLDAPLHLIIKGISDAALRVGVSVPMQFLSRQQAKDLARREKRPAALQKGMVDGVIICSGFNELIIDSLGLSLPCVSVPRSGRPSAIDSTGPEHMHGIESIVRYLHQLGHRRIGFVCLKERPVWGLERFAAYLYAMNALGLVAEDSWIVNVRGSRIDDSGLIKPVLDATRNGVTAWVCVSDGLAQKIYSGLAEAGIRVPKDVSITGFDGVRHIRDCPELTTIVVPWREIGEGALAAVLERIDDPAACARHREYIGAFREGESTAPPRKMRNLAP